MSDYTKTQTQESYEQACAVVLELAKTLAAAADDSFGIDPEDADWGHIGTANMAMELLAEARNLLASAGMSK